MPKLPLTLLQPLALASLAVPTAGALLTRLLLHARRFLSHIPPAVQRLLLWKHEARGCRYGSSLSARTRARICLHSAVFGWSGAAASRIASARWKSGSASASFPWAR
jgi:hypothetical protein